MGFGIISRKADDIAFAAFFAKTLITAFWNEISVADIAGTQGLGPGFPGFERMF